MQSAWVALVESEEEYRRVRTLLELMRKFKPLRSGLAGYEIFNKDGNLLVPVLSIAVCCNLNHLRIV